MTTKPAATVHLPVLEGTAKAIYVARRSTLEWFIGGDGFTDDDDSRFRRVALADVLRSLDLPADVLELSVGEHAFRQGDRRSWKKGRIPVGRTFLVTYDVRPTEQSAAPPDIGGAYANCWVVCASMDEAYRIALEHLEKDGWAVVGMVNLNEKVADDLAEGSESMFRQAQIDGFVCQFHTFPADDPDVS